MQLDMHYYGTYALARAAGIKPDFAKAIATASQYVDDSDRIVCELADGGFIDNYPTAHHPSELLPNTRPEDQRHVWVPFHFLPGNEGETMAERLICAKDSAIARELVEHHLSAADAEHGYMLLGITAHVYADTFSHYGFSGVASVLNQVDADSITPQIRRQDILEYTLGKARAFWEKRAADVADLLRLGHAGVATFPDRPYLHWSFSYQDGRESGERKNAETFMEACEKLYAMFGKFATTSGERFSKANDAGDFQNIRPTLTDIISVEGKMEDRIGAWQWAAKKGSLYPNPSGDLIPDYDPSSFENDASRLPGMNRSDVKKTLVYQFMKAAAVHRDYVLNELLPKHGLEVVLP